MLVRQMPPGVFWLKYYQTITRNKDIQKGSNLKKLAECIVASEDFKVSESVWNSDAALRRASKHQTNLFSRHLKPNH